MKKILIICSLIAFFAGLTTSAMAQVTENKKIVLQGSVSTNVPRTPAEVQAYLIKMNAIMKEYETLSTQLMIILMTGSQSPGMADAAKNEWIRLANKIDAIVPPAEIKDSHKRLADSLRRSNQFLTSMSGYSAEQKQQILVNLMPVVSDLSQSVQVYHNGVASVITSYGLDPSLNPIGATGSINASSGGLGIMGSGINLNNLNIDFGNINLQNLQP